MGIIVCQLFVQQMFKLGSQDCSSRYGRDGVVLSNVFADNWNKITICVHYFTGLGMVIHQETNTSFVAKSVSKCFVNGSLLFVLY